MLLFRSIFTVMVFYLQLGALASIFCRILTPDVSSFAFRDLLFTVVIH